MNTEQASRYAAKWYADGHTGEPTDERLAAAFAGCVLVPGPEDFDAIRAEIIRQHTAPTFFDPASGRYCEARGCEREATHHTPATRRELEERGAFRWACVFHAPGTWYERLRIAPTITQGQWSDLKHEVSGHRLWLSRMTLEDGALYEHGVEVEVFHPTEYRWIPLGTFDGDSTTAAGLFDGPGLP